MCEGRMFNVQIQIQVIYYSDQPVHILYNHLHSHRTCRPSPLGLLVTVYTGISIMCDKNNDTYFTANTYNLRFLRFYFYQIKTHVVEHTNTNTTGHFFFSRMFLMLKLQSVITSSPSSLSINPLYNVMCRSLIAPLYSFENEMAPVGMTPTKSLMIANSVVRISKFLCIRPELTFNVKLCSINFDAGLWIYFEVRGQILLCKFSRWPNQYRFKCFWKKICPCLKNS